MNDYKYYLNNIKNSLIAELITLPINVIRI